MTRVYHGDAMRRLIIVLLLAIGAVACGEGDKDLFTLEECESGPSPNPFLQYSSCADMFRNVDTNQDGVIQRSECLRFVTEPFTPRGFDSTLVCQPPE